MVERTWSELSRAIRGRSWESVSHSQSAAAAGTLAGSIEEDGELVRRKGRIAGASWVEPTKNRTEATGWFYSTVRR